MIKMCTAAVVAGLLGLLWMMGSAQLAQKEQAPIAARTAANERAVSALEKQVEQLQAQVIALQPKPEKHYDYEPGFEVIGTKCMEWYWLGGKKMPMPRESSRCAFLRK